MKNLIIIVIAIVVLVLGVSMYRYLYPTSKKLAPAPIEKAVTPQQITVTGKVICLPHKDTSGPQTLECAFGIKNTAGTNYALNDPEMKYVTNLQMDTEVTITGMLNTASATDPQQKYDIAGTIEMNSVN